MTKITNPNKEAGKVPGVVVPTISNTGHKKEVFAAVSAMSPIERKTYAGVLLDRLKEQQGRVKEALKLADKLVSDGLNGEEFDSLYDYTQSDILFQLLEKTKTNATRVQVMAMVAKKARKVV